MRLLNDDEWIIGGKLLRQDKDDVWYEASNEYVTTKFLRVFDKYERLKRKHNKIKKNARYNKTNKI